MKIVKVRRVGNSNVVSIPREFEAGGYTPGASVLAEELADCENSAVLPAVEVAPVDELDAGLPVAVPATDLN